MKYLTFILTLLFMISCNENHKPTFHVQLNEEEIYLNILNQPTPMPFDISGKIFMDNEPIIGETIIVESSTHPNQIMGSEVYSREGGNFKALSMIYSKNLGEVIFVKFTHKESGEYDSVTIDVN